MMKALATIFTVVLAALASAAEPPALTLEQLQRDALRTSPDLQSLTRQIEAARAAARQASRWPNPELSVSVDKDEQKIALAQTLDIWGKLPIARRIALTQADVTAAKLTTARLELLHEVARQFWTLAGAQRRLALLDDELADWQKLLAIRKGELAAGEIATADLLTAQTLAAQRRQERWKLLAESTTARAGLSVITGRRADAGLEIKTPAWQEAGAARLDSAREAIAQALARNPLLAQIRARLEGAGFRVRQEQRRWAPDPTIGPFARNTPDEAFAGLTLSFSLPILDQNRDGIRAASASETALQADLRAAELSLVQEAFIAFQLRAQALDAFNEMSELVTGPVARQRQIAQESFTLGAISERDLLAARIDWTQREHELKTLRAQLGLAEARLARVLAKGEPGTNSSWTQIDLKD